MHNLPFGAEIIAPGLTRFRLWAPDKQNIELVIEGRSPIAMQRNDSGLFESEVDCGEGTRYRFHVGDRLLVPDPASRLQSGDVHDPSIVFDPRRYRWSHPHWRGRLWPEMVIYELHVGSLGGFDQVRYKLAELASLGITAIELMPIADFRGTRNWGYDGVLPFAPDASYGSPDQLKQLIDTAHGLGLCVYLDVVYNHFGPDGNYLHCYASSFFDPDKNSPWGAAIDFSNPWVREFFIQNALYWLQEYRFDGLRLDAVHQISDPGWIDELAHRVRSTIAPGRHVHLMLENEHNRSSHLDNGVDAQWNDDGHNVLHVMLTGESVGYYQDFVEIPAQKLARCLAEGFIFQGEPAQSQKGEPRGSRSAHLPPHAFILFLQNHDQIGNRAFGERLITLTDTARLRATIMLQLLAPQIPLLFMGEEWGCRTPFLYFTDFHDELATAVRNGRQQEFASQPAFSDPKKRAQIPDPNAERTFTDSIPTAETNAQEAKRYLAYYRKLLGLRRQYIVPRLAGCRSLGALVLNDATVSAEWLLDDGSVLRIITNLDNRAQPLSPELTQGTLLADSGTLWNTHGSDAGTDRIPGQTTRVYLQTNQLP